MQATSMPPYRLEDRERADQVGVDERRRIAQRVVVMRLGGEMDDELRVPDEVVHEWAVGDVATDHADPVAYCVQARLVGCVGHRV